MVKIIFIGVGGWISEPYLSTTSILVKSYENTLLIEAGEGIYKALKMCGYDISDINAIVLTHRHGDHILGLPTLALMALNRGLSGLNIITHEDVVNALADLFKVIGIDFAFNTLKFKIIKPSDNLRIGSFTLYFAKAIHTVPSISVKIYVEDKCIAYSGDTKYNPDMVEFVKECDILIHEVSDYSSNAGVYGHTSYVEALDIASKANIKIFIPIHFYHQPLPIDLSYLDKKLSIFVPIPCSALEL